MTDKEKLIELLKNTRANAAWHRWGYEEVSDHLIANGVTFATDNNVGSKWIPVTDRLPDTQEYDWVLVAIKLMPEDYYGVPCVAELRNGDWYDSEGGLLDTSEEGCGVIVTHWMPLPEAPKGE